MTTELRVRFAPSPTGNVHIGNIRVAIFNWLFARNQGGKFLLRVEDTDRERSSDQAIANLFAALDWLGLEHDEPPVYQSAQMPHHAVAAERLLNLDYAYLNSDPIPATVLKISSNIFADSFVTEPRDDVLVDLGKANMLRGTLRNLVVFTPSKKSAQLIVEPMPWDTIEANLIFKLENGSTLPGDEVRAAVREKCGDNFSAEESCDLAEIAESKIIGISFKRRFVFFEDLVLGYREKPLDSLRDQVIVRGNGTPVFHLANVVDDANMKITHVLRGNDHLENTFRHLFLFQAIAAKPPHYGHFPMIVNASGKPYSKRDGDAYVGEFQKKGFFPEALFNFLALCGWSPGDDREKMSKNELISAFALKRVNRAATQFDVQKFEWLNSCYLTGLADNELLDLLRLELEKAELSLGERDEKWCSVFLKVCRERIKTVAEMPLKFSYLFADKIEIKTENKKVRKVLRQERTEEVLLRAEQIFANLPAWQEDALESTVNDLATELELKMGNIAQPLRIAVTGGTVSPGIGETLFLLGREKSLKRLALARDLQK